MRWVYVLYLLVYVNSSLSNKKPLCYFNASPRQMDLIQVSTLEGVRRESGKQQQNFLMFFYY